MSMTDAQDPQGSPPAAPLYVARKKVYPQSVRGTFRNLKWTFMAVALGIYYLLPFVRWDRGPNAPDQAVLIDFPNRRFYFFFIEIWPQEVYYITGLLILAAMILFLMNAVAGRVWCGYMCPQTVWTDLFYAVERLIEGDRRERMKLDKQNWSFNKLAERATKHVLWLLIAWWTGRRLGALLRRCADAGETAAAGPGAVLRLPVDRHPDRDDLRLRRSHARAGLHLHVPVAAHPGRR